MEEDRREGKKAPTSAARKDADIETMKKSFHYLTIAVSEEDTPTPATETLRYVRRVNSEPPPSPTPKPKDDLSNGPTRPHDDFNWERVRVRKKGAPIVNAAGTNKSAAAGSTSLNSKRLHEDTENLAFNAAGTNKSAAAGSTSLNSKRLHEDTENLAFNAAGTNKSAAAGRISLKIKGPGKDHDWRWSDFPPRPAEADDSWMCYRVGTGRKGEDDLDYEYVWEKHEVVPVKLETRKLSKAALAMRRKRFQI